MSLVSLYAPASVRPILPVIRGSGMDSTVNLSGINGTAGFSPLDYERYIPIAGTSMMDAK